MGLIRILGIVLLIYLALRLITRFLLPLAARYFIKKASATIEERMRTQQEGERIFQEGEITIRKTGNAAKNTPPTNTEGEYVDYEDV